MNSKKSKKANLEGKRMVYLPIGLIVATSMCLVAFEWRVAGSSPKLVELQESDNYDYAEFVYDEIEKPDPKPEIPTPPTPNPNPNPDPNPNPVSTPRNITNVVQGQTQNDLGDLTLEPIFGDINVNTATAVDILIDNIQLSEPAEFPGGMEAMYEFLGNHLDYPNIASEMGIGGTVNVEFIIGKDGSIESAKPIGTHVGGGCDEEAVRVVKSMPKWKPGEQFGMKVRVRYILPIKFSKR